ncbi:hypothetical protein [Thermosporothrix hazakensis]|uniref:hypothetical protein n=1 Tax=Thermosporothrix hazakensis TaxID=644383 RepID=UPI0010F7CA93|nr:hypothetical protein [Thermosporothrix hazakensis]
MLQATTDGLVVGGPNVRTSTPTFNWSAGGTFANFDYAEVVPVDDLYDFGTVICPSDSNPDYWTRCTHVACPAAMVIVESPGMSLGVANNPNQYYGQNPWYNPNLPLSFHAALVGRVAVPSMQEDIPLRAFVCSDGNGGIRAMADDEHGMALGVCIGPVLNGKAPVLLRPVWR